MELDALYRDIVETSPDGIWVFDLDGRTLVRQRRDRPHVRLRRVRAARPDGLRHARRGRPRTVRRAPATPLRRGEVNTADVEGQFVRRDGTPRCGCWCARAPCAPRTARSPASCTGSATTAPGARSSTSLTQEPAAARRGPADRPDRQLGLGPRRATRSPAPTSSTRSTAATRESFGGTYADFIDMVHPNDRAAVDAGGPGGPRRRRRVRVRGPGAGRATTGSGPAAAGCASATTPARLVSISGTHQDITEAKLAEDGAGGLGRPERADAGGRDRRQRGPHARGRARATRGRWCCCTTTGSGPAAFVPAADGSGVVPLLRLRRGPRRRRRRPGRPRGRARARQPRVRASAASVWDDARLTIAFPVSLRRRGLRGRHDHVGAAALPPRHDPLDGRAGRRPARPGGRARARRGRAGGRPRRARWRPPGRSRSSWPP